MAQSVKRALKVDPNHPQLHSCLIRLHRFLTDGDLLNGNVSHPAVASVLKSETQPLFRHHQDAEQLNKEHLEQNANSLPHLLQGITCAEVIRPLWELWLFLFYCIIWWTGAKMMGFLNPDRQAEAVSLVTRLTDTHQGVTVEVILSIYF